MSKQLLMAKLDGVVGVKSTYEQNDEQWGALVFDWDSLSAEFRASFVSEIFGDCDEGDFPTLIDMVGESTEHGTLMTPTWKDGVWLPFALTNVQEDDAELVYEDDFAAYPQFDQLLLVKLDEISDGNIPVYSIDVDGTAIVTPEPEPFWDNLGDTRFAL